MTRLEKQHAEVAVKVCQIVPVFRDLGKLGCECILKLDRPSSRFLGLPKSTPFADTKTQRVITACKISSIIGDAGEIGSEHRPKFQGPAVHALRFREFARIPKQNGEGAATVCEFYPVFMDLGESCDERFLNLHCATISDLRRWVFSQLRKDVAGVLMPGRPRAGPPDRSCILGQSPGRRPAL